MSLQSWRACSSWRMFSQALGSWQGYIEGEFVYAASPFAGNSRARGEPGHEVKGGQLLSSWSRSRSGDLCAERNTGWPGKVAPEN